MIILSIETSCDETAVSIIEATGEFPVATYEILGNALFSQASMHAEYGGVFPAVAKREHAKTLVPMLEAALIEADMLETSSSDISDTLTAKITHTLEREPDMHAALTEFLKEHSLPTFDLIAVTNGPGLAPALWVGVSFAKALSQITGAPMIGTNHMEGHILASIFDVEEDDQLSPIVFPAIALLISGGHTELVLMSDWNTYKKIGQTRDDAVGEAFDKVARLMGLSYPGGPIISKLAAEARSEQLPPFKDDLPRPMLHSKDLDFSFSGLKTAVRYAVADTNLSETNKKALSRDFEDCVRDVLITKTKAAVEQYGAQTLIIGGGVSANQYLMRAFKSSFIEDSPELVVYTPNSGLSTDNSIMIALAGHAHMTNASNPAAAKYIVADGNKSL